MNNNSDNVIHLFEDGMVSVPQASAFLGISKSHLYTMMDRGELPFSKFGKSRRIPKRALISLAHRNAYGLPHACPLNVG